MYHYDWSEIRPIIKDTVLSLEKYNKIASQYTGYSGTTSDIWKTQNWLISKATTAELEKLITYDNSAIKGIAFEALIKRKHPKIFTYIVNSVDYEKPVYAQLGCLGYSFGLTEYYIFLISDRMTKNDNVKANLFIEDQLTVIDSISKIKTRYLVY